MAASSLASSACTELLPMNASSSRRPWQLPHWLARPAQSYFPWMPQVQGGHGSFLPGQLGLHRVTSHECLKFREASSLARSACTELLPMNASSSGWPWQLPPWPARPAQSYLPWMPQVQGGHGSFLPGQLGLHRVTSHEFLKFTKAMTASSLASSACTELLPMNASSSGRPWQLPPWPARPAQSYFPWMPQVQGGHGSFLPGQLSLHRVTSHECLKFREASSLARSACTELLPMNASSSGWPWQLPPWPARSAQSYFPWMPQVEGGYGSFLPGQLGLHRVTSHECLKLREAMAASSLASLACTELLPMNASSWGRQLPPWPARPAPEPAHTDSAAAHPASPPSAHHCQPPAAGDDRKLQTTVGQEFYCYFSFAGCFEQIRWGCLIVAWVCFVCSIKWQSPLKLALFIVEGSDSVICLIEWHQRNHWTCSK